MSDKTISQKLLLKPGQEFLLVNPPPGYLDRVGSIPEGANIRSQTSSPVSMIQVFVTSQAQLEKVLPSHKANLEPGGILWVSYPKGTSRLASDINRDSIWKFARSIGMEAVALFAVDETWSAMRLKLVP